MPRPSTTHLSAGPRITASTFDICALIPIAAFAYSSLIQPLIYFGFPPSPGLQGLLESRVENRIFWPALAAIALIAAAQRLARGGRLSLPPNIISLCAYFGFAGASVAWALKPEFAFVRFVQEAMVLTAIVLPALLSSPAADMMRGMFACFAAGVILNVLLIPGGYASYAQYGAQLVDIGYQGYFSGKNLLGEFAATGFLLALHELRYAGHRRVLGLVVAIGAVTLIFISSSKTALGLALLAPALALLVLLLARSFRLSPVLILAAIVLGYIVLSELAGFSTNRIAYLLTGDSSFTGRTTIWAFSKSEIAQRPLLGWGYQSFWLVGADAPSVTEAPGWVKAMPNSHNGFYDTMLELGYVGLTLLLVFLATTVHVIGRVLNYDFKRAWVLLSIALFVMIYNFLETLWLRAFDVSWVVFVLVTVEAARHWRRPQLAMPIHQPAPKPSARLIRTRPMWRPRLGIRF
ncbi:putative exopolysaccharide production protein (ExoQ-like); membrane protein [Bradyrhizobium sp. ORS 375]|uniref:O-antigen ligase family protein n=1 Tax=Bradyrhizobium sp. (strain ORS 375) TaxID=566679 RepID=UPI0002405E9F|nr:O-antigen ligase family protein [Bradyrhizobium sp. ORS 375]CCD94993.1 putative exopolysaccharide production protein (ExoQ-like); membrane protein [Bradyrhizobium sp. ORS 375]